MRFKKILIALAVCMAFAIVGCTAQQPSKEAADAPAPRADHVDIPGSVEAIPSSYQTPCDEQGSLEYFYYEGPALEDGAENSKYAIVYLPYGYDPEEDTPYNVLYLMHGAGGSAEGQLGTPDDRDDEVNMIDHMIANGDMEPMIIVAATYYPNNEEIDTDDWDAALTKEFGTELRDYLMPQLEEEYNTYASDTTPEGLKASREHRAFGGFSMGGVTTWYRVCDSMDYFKYFLPVSGCLTWGTEHYSGDAAAQFIENSIQKQGFEPSDFFIYATTGENDYALGYYNPQIQAMQSMGDPFVFEGNNQNIAFLVNEGEEHDGDGYARALYGGLPVISQMMQA